jgi:hypothetical protein
VVKIAQVHLKMNYVHRRNVHTHTTKARKFGIDKTLYIVEFGHLVSSISTATRCLILVDLFARAEKSLALL